MLLGAAVIGAIAQRLKISYAVALVLGGLVAGQVSQTRLPQVDPDIVLFVFLPPLLFDAAFRIDARELRLILRPVLLLAIPGTLLTAALAGAFLTIFLDFNLAEGLLFGSIVAATDAVAVLSIVQRLGLPARVSLVLEGESLFNDGMAITLYSVLAVLVATGSVGSQSPFLVFAIELIGGIAVGSVLAFALSRVTMPLDGHLLEMMFTTSLAYGSYLLADSIHASGPLACVAAGLIHGSYGRTIGMSTKTSDRLDDLWEFLGFMANALLFLLIGFSVNIQALLDHLGPTILAIIAVFIARVAVVEGTGLLIRRPGQQPTRRAERIVVIWGGLRGALTVTLVLGLPEGIPQRDLLTSMAFGVVLFSLVVQGLTLPLVVRRLGLARVRSRRGGSPGPETREGGDARHKDESPGVASPPTAS